MERLVGEKESTSFLLIGLAFHNMNMPACIGIFRTNGTLAVALPNYLYQHLARTISGIILEKFSGLSEIFTFPTRLDFRSNNFPKKLITWLKERKGWSAPIEDAFTRRKVHL